MYSEFVHRRSFIAEHVSRVCLTTCRVAQAGRTTKSRWELLPGRCSWSPGAENCRGSADPNFGGADRGFAILISTDPVVPGGLPVISLFCCGTERLYYFMNQTPTRVFCSLCCHAGAALAIRGHAHQRRRSLQGELPFVTPRGSDGSAPEARYFHTLTQASFECLSTLALAYLFPHGLLFE